MSSVYVHHALRDTIVAEDDVVEIAVLAAEGHVDRPVHIEQDGARELVAVLLEEDWLDRVRGVLHLQL